MRPILVGLLLLCASLSGCIEELDKKGIIIDCSEERIANNSYSNTDYERRECEIIEVEVQSENRTKEENRTATAEPKREDRDSNSENEENRTRERESEA